MARGLYQHVAEIWKKPKGKMEDVIRQRMISWRREQTVVRVDKPTRIDRARALGYKAKQGYVISRVKVRKGGRRRAYYGRRGRKPSKFGLVQFTAKKSDRWIAEEKAGRKFPNLEVLNSYQVGEDGQHKWFEIILVDPQSPSIKNDPKISWIGSPANRRRAVRGLTSAGQKARGLRS